MNSRCAVLVNSCDTYDDLWYPFFYFMQKFWSDCPYSVFLNTESKNYELNGIRYKSLGNGKMNLSYGKRLKNCLNKLDTEYVILLLDDFFLRKKVCQQEIEQIISYMDSDKGISYFCFDDHADCYDLEDERFPNYKLRSICGEYKFNLQAAVWRRKDLINAWKDNESPWQWELYGNLRSWKKDFLGYVVKSIELAPIYYGFNKEGMGVYGGKWVKDDVCPFFEKYGVEVDYSKRGFYYSNERKIPHKLRAFLYSAGVIELVRHSIWKYLFSSAEGSYSKYRNKKYYS